MQFSGRPNTIKTKSSLFKKWVAPTINVSSPDLPSAIQLWQSKGLSVNTIKSLLHITKDYVKQYSGVDLNIKAHISSVVRSKQRLPVTALTAQEIASLTQSCKASDPKLYLPFMIALNTGMRRGEIFGLKWSNVNLAKGTLQVCESYNGPTKNGKTRIVPINDTLKALLLAKRPKGSYNCKEPVIRKRFDPNPRLRKLCRQAGIREINFHALRHSFATLALEAGRSPKLVSMHLGHSAVSTTLDLYWQPTQPLMNLEFLPNV